LHKNNYPPIFSSSFKKDFEFWTFIFVHFSKRQENYEFSVMKRSTHWISVKKIKWIKKIWHFIFQNILDIFKNLAKKCMDIVVQSMTSWMHSRSVKSHKYSHWKTSKSKILQKSRRPNLFYFIRFIMLLQNARIYLLSQHNQKDAKCDKNVAKAL
jgi:CRISPR/Cas system CSM-associated protein Csm4 (group 5 of RAMP superfamily)